MYNQAVEAFIGAGSSVTALGSTGLSVRATSSQTLFTVAIAGAGGSTAGVAGSAPVNVVNQKTHAFIADGSLINAGAIDPLLGTTAAGQGVTVAASADTQELSIGGGLAAGGTFGGGAGRMFSP